MTQPQAAPLPGQLFDIPGIPGGSTQWYDMDDTTVNSSTTLSQAAIAPINGVQPLKQTDVVVDWTLCVNITQTYALGGGTIVLSAYAPMQAIGATRLLIQNQYASVDVESGIDIYIFNLIRPFSLPEIVSGVNNYANPAGSPVAGTATGYDTTALAQVNNINAAAYTNTTTNYNLMLRLPAAQWFDRYYDVALTGEPLTQGFPALVTPQYMAGTTRNILPLINFNPGFATTSDNANATFTGGATYTAATALTRIRRRAIYAGNQAVSPPVYAWQYRWRTQRFNANGVSRIDLLLPNDTGQLLAVYARMFDPAAGGGIGAPININTLTRANLQYGSGLFWFDAQNFGTGPTTAGLLQRRWLQTHNSLLPAGVIAWDLATDERGQVTNARALNTLTTAGILVHLEFTAPLSASAYIVLGTESLVYVA